MQRYLDADVFAPVSNDLAVGQTIPEVKGVTRVAFLKFRTTRDIQKFVAMRISHGGFSLVAKSSGLPHLFDL
jgi:hypothetical protein